ncbi:hypothetical protein PoB_007063600 [Plakobranchus ocellatus]|uniref:ATR-interacting protein n=1 Tax=Plakobranchus ocellatus TaxID=259542 RepID=A0AAV4DJT7_9GAST|nr:hypothetical protein PoB_007063600 [Plakobranchus ocellatus]
MAFSRQKGKLSERSAWSVEESARKRRRLERDEKAEQASRGKDDWDDSMELTQAELETLDVIASQAIDEDAPGVSREVQMSETAAAAAAASEMLFFAKPSYMPHSLARRSTSSSSGSSVHPVSLSSRSASDASGSLSSHASENGKTDVSGDTVKVLRTKLEEEMRKAQEEKYRSAGEMAFLRESLRRQEEELEKVRAERDAGMEQEKLVQRENEKLLQAKIDGIMSEAQFKDREFKCLQEQFQALQQKMKKLEQERQQQHPTMSNTAESPTRISSPQKVPVKPSPPSKQRLKQMEDAGLHSKGFPTRQTFMEQTTSSPHKSSVVTPGTSTGCQTTGSIVMSPKVNRRLKLKISSHHDVEKVSGSEVVQHLLMSSPPSHLAGVEGHTEDWDPGLMGLMHAMSTTLRVANLSYSRTGGSAVTSLSPMKPKGHTPKKFSKDESGGTLQVVSKEHFQLAVDGLSQLLNERISERHRGHEETLNRKTNSQNQYAASNLIDVNENLKTYADAPSSSSTSLSKPSPNKPVKLPPQSSSSPVENQTSSLAALLLPLLTDYIQHYVDLLGSPRAKNSSSLTRSQHHLISPYHSTLDSNSHSTTGSSSFESSLDSLNSSVLQLLHDGHVYAAGIEGYACAALRCTAILLLLCPTLVDVILAPHLQLKTSTSTFTSSTSGNSSAVETDAKSEVEADDEKSVSSCEIRILAAACEQASATSPDTRPSVHSPVLFHLVLQLAAQDLKDSSCAPGVMAQALHVLSLLCQRCRDEHIPKLESIIVRGVLTNCLRHTSHMLVIVWAVKLLQSLATHIALFSKLCVKSENCPLFLMHQVSSYKDVKWKQSEMVLFYRQYISCLSSMVSEQQKGLYHLLSNSCPCSNELVPGIVLVLYKLFCLYRQDSKSSSTKQSSSSDPTLASHPPGPHLLSQEEEESGGLLWTLGQGVTLLHAVAQADAAFVQHHSPIQPQYISLLSGLRAVFKASTAGWDFHLSALEELCDFDPDLSDLSQESEAEEKMDQG